MSRGGNDPRSGRKLSAATKPHTSRPTINMPLEVMLEAMRQYWAQGEWDRAAAIAKVAAPYVHPRLSSIEEKPAPIDVTKLTDEELGTLRRIYQRAERVSDAD
jgi:hypothetical protein